MDFCFVYLLYAVWSVNEIKGGKVIIYVQFLFDNVWMKYALVVDS
jgi:hypothetical protein